MLGDFFINKGKMLRLKAKSLGIVRNLMLSELCIKKDCIVSMVFHLQRFFPSALSAEHSACLL